MKSDIYTASMRKKQHEMSEEKLLIWKKKRFSTFLIFCLQYLLNGVASLFIHATLWIYVTTLLSIHGEPFILYGVLSSLIFLPSILFTAIVAKLADIYRKPKLFLLIINFIVIFGYFLYIQSSLLTSVLCGCFFIGFEFTIRAAMIGEIGRLFQLDDLHHKLPIFSHCFHLGFCGAGTLMIFLEKVNFYIAHIHITYANVGGVIAFATIAFMQILATCFVHNLSHEYDLNENGFQEKYIKNDKDWFKQSLYILKHPDIIISYFLTFLGSFLETFSLKYLPIVILQTLDYSSSALNITLILLSITSVVLVCMLINIKLTPSQAYHMIIIAFIAIIVVGGRMDVMQRIKEPSMNFTIIVLIIICLSIYFLADNTFLVCIVSQLVSTELQSDAESMRMMSRQLGCLLGSLFIKLIHEYYEIFLVSYTIIIVLVIIILTTVHGKNLRYPTLVVEYKSCE